MEFEKLNKEGLHYECGVVLSPEEIENSIEERVKQRAKTYKMQGFRTGHVPLNIVRQNVERYVISDVLEDLISKACGEIVKESGVKDLATQPTYRFKENFSKGKNVAITVYFDAAPSFEIQPYDFEVEKVVPNVTGDDIANAEKLLITNAPVREDAEDGYEIQPGDEVSFYATCYQNGMVSKKDSFSNTVVLPSTITEDMDLYQLFIGKKDGDTFEYDDPKSAGTKYKIQITQIRKVVQGLALEEYATKRGFKDLQEMRDVIKQKLEEDINEGAYLYHKAQILEKLVDEYKFELPKAIVEQEMRFTISQMKKEQQSLKEQNPETKIESEEELRENLKDVVNQRCMVGYILNKIAVIEKITVTDEDLRRAIYAEIKKSPSDASRIVEYYNRKDSIAYKKAEMLERRVIEFLMNKAKCKEVSKTKDELKTTLDNVLEMEI